MSSEKPRVILNSGNQFSAIYTLIYTLNVSLQPFSLTTPMGYVND